MFLPSEGGDLTTYIPAVVKVLSLEAKKGATR